MECGSAHELKLPYGGFLSREKTFANYLKIDFRGENFREFAVTQCTTPTSAVSNYCLKIDFRGENSRIATETRNSRRFLPRKKIRYWLAMARLGAMARGVGATASGYG